MAKAELSALVTPRAQRIADQLGFELVDVSLDSEHTGRYLRIYIDRPGGMDLDGCERYHRLIQPLVEDFDYDFLEVSSPGADRPLKKDKDFERAMGTAVELRLFKALNGRKELHGLLTGFDRQNVTLRLENEEEMTLPRKACALIRQEVDLSGVLELEAQDDRDYTAGEELPAEETAD